MIPQRYFCTSDELLYEQVRQELDQAWGHIAPVTCIDPANVAPRDRAGRIVLAVRQEFADFPAAAAILPNLLANGNVIEIDEAEYLAAIVR